MFTPPLSSEPRAKVLTPHLRVVHLHPSSVRIRHADEDVSDDSRVFTSLDNTVCHDSMEALSVNCTETQRFLAAAVDGNQHVLIHHERSRVHLATAAELMAPQHVSIHAPTECLEPALIQARVHEEKQQAQGDFMHH